MILVRGRVEEGRRATLRWWPERRVVHAVRLADGGWVGNLHATVHHGARAQADIDRARARLLEWAAGAPVALGGDFNIRRPVVEGFQRVAATKVDFVFARGWEAVGPAQRLEHAPLSDHAPLAVNLRPAG